MKNIKFMKKIKSDQENSDKFSLKKDQQELGYAYIYHGDFKNNIYIFIHPEHRSNGYGNLLFSYIIRVLKLTTKFPHIILDIDKTNIHTNNIIAKNGGLILSEDTETHWMLKL
ncbi:MAG: GNAT family N-acetyltransferase [Clostridia bacterium]|nr:GNAT family N-acetyltransferase [Clostridia bacterium]